MYKFYYYISYYGYFYSNCAKLILINFIVLSRKELWSNFLSTLYFIKINMNTESLKIKAKNYSLAFKICNYLSKIVKERLTFVDGFDFSSIKVRCDDSGSGSRRGTGSCRWQRRFSTSARNSSSCRDCVIINRRFRCCLRNRSLAKLSRRFDECIGITRNRRSRSTFGAGIGATRGSGPLLRIVCVHSWS